MNKLYTIQTIMNALDILLNFLLDFLLARTTQQRMVGTLFLDTPPSFSLHCLCFLFEHFMHGIVSLVSNFLSKPYYKRH